MRWLKFGTLIIVFLLAVYAVSMTFVAESKSFTVEKEINYPVDKVFPQFNNLQNFSRWSGFFARNKNLTFDFFTPYEGQGSSMSYHDKKNKTFLEICLSGTKILIKRSAISCSRAKRAIPILSI